MRRGANKADSRRAGIAAILALMFLVLLASLAVAMANSSFLELRQGNNCVDSTTARMSAESGLTYMMLRLQDFRVPPNTQPADFFTQLKASVTAKMRNTNATVVNTATGFGVTTINLSDLTFSHTFTLLNQTPPACRMVVTGLKGRAVRHVAVTLVCVPKREALFDYGVASKGKITISGSASIVGKTQADEASILSTLEEPMAIEAGGHADVSGNLYVTDSDVDSVLLKGNGLTIGGSSDNKDILANHVFLGTRDPGFPDVSTDPLATLATHTVDKNTDFNGTKTFTNIRIKAGTNPSFGSDTVINGIVYVEAPNVVTFTGKATVNGFIATQAASASQFASCQIDFKGQASVPGVGALPKTSEFAAVRAAEGTAIVAPGFGLTFRGTTNSINGVIAADQLSFRGNANIAGDMTGTILGLKNLDLTLSGNTTIEIKRQDSSVVPAGFNHSLGLSVLSASYDEPVGP
jgi:Tfp pilus assembly protein PilX